MRFLANIACLLACNSWVAMAYPVDQVVEGPIIPGENTATPSLTFPTYTSSPTPSTGSGGSSTSCNTSQIIALINLVKELEVKKKILKDQNEELTRKNKSLSNALADCIANPNNCLNHKDLLP